MLLKVDRVTAGYGLAIILHELCVELEKGEIICVIGPNGAGKSTLLKVIAGLIRPAGGKIIFQDQDFNGISIAQRGERGIIFVPQGNNIFPNLTILENLEIASAVLCDRERAATAIKAVLDEFSFLKKKRSKAARILSGGERQILALSRLLILQPSLALLDEPSLGLAPLLVDMIYEQITEMNHRGISLLIVEQNARKALSVSHRGYVLELGQNRITGTGRELLDNPDVQRLYLGG
jgi:ABC-type branched-subunit amino acid transport system ATPase component